MSQIQKSLTCDKAARSGMLSPIFQVTADLKKQKPIFKAEKHLSERDSSENIFYLSCF